MAGKRKRTTDSVEVLHRGYFEGRQERLAQLEEERASAAVAREIRGLRRKAGLTQTELAKLVGTTVSAICRMEDAGYGGPSLSLLRRVAAVLDRRVEIRFVPAKRKVAEA